MQHGITHEEVHILWYTFCRKLIHHIYTKISQFISIFIAWKWGHLVIIHKVKHTFYAVIFQKWTNLNSGPFIGRVVVTMFYFSLL